jgi:hypothetical protein
VGDWRLDWEEVDGYLWPRTRPLTREERERKWVADNWEWIERGAARVEAAQKCAVCKQEIYGVRHEYRVDDVTRFECDECYYLRPPPPDTRAAEHLSDRQYHGGFGSHTVGRFRNADDV